MAGEVGQHAHHERELADFNGAPVSTSYVMFTRGGRTRSSFLWTLSLGICALLAKPKPVWLPARGWSVESGGTLAGPHARLRSRHGRRARDYYLTVGNTEPVRACHEEYVDV